MPHSYISDPFNNSASAAPMMKKVFRISKFREDFSSDEIHSPPEWVFSATTQQPSHAYGTARMASPSTKYRSRPQTLDQASQKLADRSREADDAVFAELERQRTTIKGRYLASRTHKLCKRIVKACMCGVSSKAEQSPSDEEALVRDEKVQQGSREADDAIIAEAEKVKVPRHRGEDASPVAKKAPRMALVVKSDGREDLRTSMEALRREREKRRDWTQGF